MYELSSGYLRDNFGMRVSVFMYQKRDVLMNRRSKTIEQRNREIYEDYCARIRNGFIRKTRMVALL